MELARSIKRIPAELSNDADLIEKVNTRPQDFLHRAAWGAMPRQVGAERMRPVDRAREDSQPRKTKEHPLIATIKGIPNYGFTSHCQRCDYLRDHGNTSECRQPHAHERRFRTSNQFEKTPEGVQRLVRIAERCDLDDEADAHDAADGESRPGSEGISTREGSTPTGTGPVPASPVPRFMEGQAGTEDSPKQPSNHKFQRNK